METRNLCELAIFSVREFVFGVDASQIQEIVTTKELNIVVPPEQHSPCLIVRHHQHLLPLFHLAQKFHPKEEGEIALVFPLTFVTFWRADFLIGGIVDQVVKVTPVHVASMQPLPEIMRSMAKKKGVWGFHEISDTLISLIDLPEIITAQDIAFYQRFLHSE